MQKNQIYAYKEATDTVFKFSFLEIVFEGGFHRKYMQKKNQDTVHR